MFLLKIIFVFVSVWKCFFCILNKCLWSGTNTSKPHFDKARQRSVMITEWDKLNSALGEKKHALSMLELFNSTPINKWEINYFMRAFRKFD